MSAFVAGRRVGLVLAILVLSAAVVGPVGISTANTTTSQSGGNKYARLKATIELSPNSTWQDRRYTTVKVSGSRGSSDVERWRRTDLRIGEAYGYGAPTTVTLDLGTGVWRYNLSCFGGSECDWETRTENSPWQNRRENSYIFITYSTTNDCAASTCGDFNTTKYVRAYSPEYH